MFSRASIIIKNLLGTVAIILGYTISPVALFLVVMSLVYDGATDYTPALIVFLICLALGIFLIIKGSQIVAGVKRFRRYVGIISANHIVSIRIIASIVSRSTDFVRKDMQRMINKKYFIDAFIDYRTDDIIIGGGRQYDAGQAGYGGGQAGYNAGQAVYGEGYETVVCKACGAPNSARKGDSNKCEYCGSAL